jgi:hypothetical protein
MNYSKFNWLALLFLIAAWPLFTFPLGAHAQEWLLKEADVANVGLAYEGPSAALDFEKNFRTKNDNGKPVPLDECQNIRQLTEEFWSKKHVLSDFKEFRTEGQIGAIVIVKTEFCCDGSRLCAVTTACMEKKSTPLIGRFRVYAGWIKNHPNHHAGSWDQWDQKVIDEYGFNQGPGARIVVMVPTFDGKMYQWFSDAADLELSLSYFEYNKGQTPKLERFLAVAVKYAPGEATGIEPSEFRGQEESSALHPAASLSEHSQVKRPFTARRRRGR